MPAFSPAFSSGFAAGPAGPAPELGTASIGLAISIVSPLVFASTAGYVKWSVTVIVGGVDVSAKLTGAIKITAGEDAARVASFSLIPASAAQLAGFDSQPVSIDITLFRTGQMATLRRFTGMVELVEFNPAARIAEISCRDGYQDRPGQCSTADEVEALFGGMAWPSRKIVPWNDDKPDPRAYFSALQPTLLGACFIDGAGLWRARPWHIGAPLATFGAGEVFDDSVQISRAARRDLPATVKATLNFRYTRLHAAEKNVTWADPGHTDHLVDGLPHLPKATVSQVLSAVPGWLVKGKINMTSPQPGSYPVLVNGNTLYYSITYDTAQNAVETLSATLYRRWYQQVQVAYTMTVDAGGSGPADEVTASMASTFEGGDWETAPSVETTVGLYVMNAPVVAVPPTGYEGLPAPFPPPNSALDYFPDFTTDDFLAAGRHATALAVRRAAEGKRRQVVRFERPIDPRWEIGDVLAIDVYGASATGQVVAFDESLDLDSGEAVTALTLACPDGSGTVTGFTALLEAPTSTVGHALAMAAASTHVGARSSTPSVPIEDNLIGFLCNVIPSTDHYDASKPVYDPQFRIIMPEIPAVDRDPLNLTTEIAASITLAGSGITLSF